MTSITSTPGTMDHPREALRQAAEMDYDQENNFNQLNQGEMAMHIASKAKGNRATTAKYAQRTIGLSALAKRHVNFRTMFRKANQIKRLIPISAPLRDAAKKEIAWESIATIANVS